MFLYVGFKPPTFNRIVSVLEKNCWLRVSEILELLENPDVAEDKLERKLHNLTSARIVERRRSDTYFVEIPPFLGHRGGKIPEFEYKLPQQ